MDKILGSYHSLSQGVDSVEPALKGYRGKPFVDQVLNRWSPSQSLVEGLKEYSRRLMGLPGVIVKIYWRRLAIIFLSGMMKKTWYTGYSGFL